LQKVHAFNAEFCFCILIERGSVRYDSDVKK
jgi:hypothetical protein